MYIQGYVFKENEKEIMEKYRKRYAEIKHLGDRLTIRKTVGYKRNSFEGDIPEDLKYLDELDLALIGDNGNLCFGGECTINGNKFKGSYCTD